MLLPLAMALLGAVAYADRGGLGADCRSDQGCTKRVMYCAKHDNKDGTQRRGVCAPRPKQGEACGAARDGLTTKCLDDLKCDNGCCGSCDTAKTLPLGYQPNFLFILVDDLGFSDMDLCPDDVPYEECRMRPRPGTFRQEIVRTPRIKQLAAEGQTMTNWYCPRAVCTPSRAAMMTGRDPNRYGLTGAIDRLLSSTAMRGGLPLDEVTVGNYLRDLGYSTGYTGKWHLGKGNGEDEFAFAPWNRGFDETHFWIVGSNGEPCHKANMNPVNDTNVYHACTFSQVYNGKGEIMEQPIRWENVTSRMLHESLGFLDRHADDGKPWLLFHAFTQVHLPWVLSRYFVSTESLRYFTDLAGEVDWAVGVLLDKLESIGAADNTMVVFTSDNGPYLEYASSYCPVNCRTIQPTAPFAENTGCSPCQADITSQALPYVGGKGQTWDGGVHVPGIVRFPGVVSGGVINKNVVGTLDFLPTAVYLAGGSVPASIEMDGSNMLDRLSLVGEQTSAMSADLVGSFYYWCANVLTGIRIGRHKVVFVTQQWNGDAPNSPPTSRSLCANTGKCCPGSPNRFCSCLPGYTDRHDPPLVFDLEQDPAEEHPLASSEAVSQLIATATEQRMAKVKNVFEDRWDSSMSYARYDVDPRVLEEDWPRGPRADWSVEDYEAALNLSPNQVSVDMCYGKYCPFVDSSLQIPWLAPYDKCSISGDPPMGPICQTRRPCLIQDGYLGPFEYVNEGFYGVNASGQQWCGGYVWPSGTSHFTDDLRSSVCDWQNLVDPNMTVFARDPICLEGQPDSVKEAMAEKMNAIAINGLNVLGQAGWMWNAPYPEDQTKTDQVPAYIRDDTYTP